MYQISSQYTTCPDPLLYCCRCWFRTCIHCFVELPFVLYVNIFNNESLSNTTERKISLIMKDLNERIRDLRKEHHLRQHEVADYLGVTQQTYSNYENGHRDIPAHVVKQLAQLYKVSTDYILCSNASYLGNVDMNAPYSDQTTLHDVIYDLQKLNKLGRKEFVDYVRYLRLRK